ncbi:MAG TPA: glycerol-3-phosphate 1-O-acyltransferase PlsY [bacterium]|nr:glycerol-3-phosphate 1-O-acyltransferase PlsY [bacterium]
MALAVIIVSYLIGAIPTGLIVVRLLTGEDIRRHGSGNIGTVNVLRVAGTGTAVVVLAVDILKGLVPVMLAVRMGLPAWTVVAGGLAAIAGHNWSVFLKFQGGKGIATSFGVLLALSWPAAAVAGAVWVVAVAITRYSSLGSLLAAVSVPLSLRWLRQPDAYVYFGIIAALFAVYRHRANIQRLVTGTELHITDREPIKK